MSETLKKLEKVVARAVIVAPSQDIRSSTTEREILLERRPWWSRIGAGELSLPGGKSEPEDYLEGLTEIDDLSLETIIYICRKTILRKIEEELGSELSAMVTQAGLYFLGFFESGGWTSVSFVVELPNKPTVQVKPDSAGTVWITEQEILEEVLSLFSDHLAITQLGLDKLEEVREIESQSQAVNTIS